MHLDCRNYPKDYTFAQVAANSLGIYVNVADFTVVGERRAFRMLVDAELDWIQLKQLMSSTIQDQHGTYEFLQVEAISAPNVDQGARTAMTSHYLRVTYI